MALPLGYGLPATLRVLAVLCGIVVARRRLETYVSPKHKGLLSSPVGYYPTPLGALLAVPVPNMVFGVVAVSVSLLSCQVVAVVGGNKQHITATGKPMQIELPSINTLYL